MPLLPLVLFFCACTVTDCASQNGEAKHAVPSLLSLCNNPNKKIVLCVICKGFDPSCFAPTTILPPINVTIPSIPSLSTIFTTTTTEATTTAAPAE